MELELEEVISKYFKNTTNYTVSEFGSGLINRTFFLQHAEGDFLLQKINHQVFKNPKDLMNNIKMISSFLKRKNYPKATLTILPTKNDELFYSTKIENYYRIFSFIKNSKSYNIPTSSSMVFEAAKGFGEFLFYLNDINQDHIVDTIPDFHNTPLRFQQLKYVIEKDSFNRVKDAQHIIQQINDFSFLIKKIQEFEQSIPLRIVHNDLKINNLLFDSNDSIKAVIDWDTIMKGNILYDFGDMVRTMACTQNEESIEFEQVKIKRDYLDEIIKGFSASTFSFLTTIEKENLIYGAPFIIYEQAIRFFTDYLNGDIYYNTTYTNQNLNRTKNQLALLEDLLKITF